MRTRTHDKTPEALTPNDPQKQTKGSIMRSFSATSNYSKQCKAAVRRCTGSKYQSARLILRTCKGGDQRKGGNFLKGYTLGNGSLGGGAQQHQTAGTISKKEREKKTAKRTPRKRIPEQKSGKWMDGNVR